MAKGAWTLGPSGAGAPLPPYDLYFCEPYMDGPFEKYNNNDGDVGPRSAERNTPQAFSHFSYVHSGKQHLIVDIHPGGGGRNEVCVWPSGLLVRLTGGGWRST